MSSIKELRKITKDALIINKERELQKITKDALIINKERELRKFRELMVPRIDKLSKILVEEAKRGNSSANLSSYYETVTGSYICSSIFESNDCNYFKDIVKELNRQKKYPVPLSIEAVGKQCHVGFRW
jgi:hypothetical protein